MRTELSEEYSTIPSSFSSSSDKFRAAPQDRVFDASWRDNLGGKGLRFFAPREITRIFGFPADFVWPDCVSSKQRYELLGNSLNVVVAANLLSFLLEHTTIKSKGEQRGK
jgi:site-specific DNA-cytosine methylase